MDPITLASLSIALGAALTKLAEIIAEKTVELGIEPALEAAREKILKGYHKAQADEELRDTILAALDEMRAETPIPHERLKITNWVTGQTSESYDLLAATAVEMTELNPKKIPIRLVKALQLDESQRELLARFLIYLREKLAGTESYGRLIAYADELEQRGSLAGLTKEVESIAQDTRRVRSLLEQFVAQQGLTVDDARAVETYLAHCRQRWGRLMLPLVRKHVGVIETNLKRVFVPLTVRDEKAELEARKEEERRAVRSRLDETQTQVQPLDFYTGIAKYPRFILVGLPGSGKTTLLRRVALALAEGRSGEDLGWEHATKLPIFVRLRNFGIYLAENREKFSAPGAGALVAYLEQNLRNDEGIDIPHDFFERRLSSGGCVILLDGLDEVLENRVEVAQFINAFIQKYAQYDNRIGISSRPKGYEGDTQLQLRQADLALLEVMPLPPASICDLISKLLPLLEGDTRQRQKDYARLSERILTNKNLSEIASVPLFCSALVQVFKYHQADLPQRRVDVLTEIVDLLLGFWYAQQTEIRDPEKLAQADGTGRQYIETQESVEQKFNRLAYLAYAMQAEIGQAEISAEEAQRRLAAYLMEDEGILPGEARRWARSFLRSAHEQSGLFVESNPGIHSFLHKNFMEFFAATSLLVEQDEPLDIIRAHLDEEWWEPVLLMAAAHP